MFRPVVNRQNGLAIGLYMHMVREYLPMNASAEADVKEAIKRAGGCNNQSGLFLSPTSTATVVNSKTGKIQRSVSYIP